ncbi:MAG: class I SAM-dependent methyltransferase [Myxococcales bacterium]|nr:class I SAM-dependent methyltransferase [Myxococcales bacterium]
MPAAEHYPLYLPADARRAFATDRTCRRLAKVAMWDGSSRLLELCGGQAGFFLAREIGCTVVLADADPHVLESIRDRAKASQVSDQVEIRQVQLDRLPFPEAEFEGILAVGRVPLPLGVACRGLRRHLVPSGRLVLTYPVRVGRSLLKVAVEYWEKRLGEKLLQPFELMQVLEREGFEPEGVETLEDQALDEYYRDLEVLLSKSPPENPAQLKAITEEVELHRALGSRHSVSFALAIGRRKEPGEKPPVSRDGG